MSIKFRLTLMSFFQFLCVGAWLITVANYWFGTKNWDGAQFGAIFFYYGNCIGFMPTLCGIIADRWINAEKIIWYFTYFRWFNFVLCTTNFKSSRFLLGNFSSYDFYMPTIALSNSVAYNALKKEV